MALCCIHINTVCNIQLSDYNMNITVIIIMVVHMSIKFMWAMSAVDDCDSVGSLWSDDGYISSLYTFAPLGGCVVDVFNVTASVALGGVNSSKSLIVG